MAFFRPLLETLIARNQADIETSIPGSDARLRRSNLNIIAKIISVVAHGLHGHIAFLVEQIFPKTATSQYLYRIASFWLAVPRKAASFATGQVVLTGTNGILIPAGSIVSRSDGIEYDTDADVSIVAGQAIANVSCLTAGQTGNAVASTQLTLSSPIAGINGAALVHSTGISGGADQETDAELSNRVIKRVQNPPHGGSKLDFEQWALEVPGVTRAWPYPNELGAGTLTLRFVRDNDVSLIPDAGEVATVQAYIDNLRPTSLKAFNVVAPVAAALNFTINLTPDTAAVRAAVEAELRDLIQRQAVPGGTILLSHIREAISIAAGETDYVMSVPAANVINTTGLITTFGVVTWL